jgi:REP element-mobilizing transposase RayT
MPLPADSKRLRIGRYSQKGQIYLVTSVTHNRQPFFSDWITGRLLVNHFRIAQQQRRANALAWVVMPDHFHWLIELEKGDLPALVLAVKSRAARDINKHLGRSGQLWQRGFHDRAIREEEDLLTAGRYIITNPIRAGLVRRVHDYPLWDAKWI